MDDFEDDFDIENENELMEDHDKAKLASEINMVKAISEEFLEEGREKIQHAKHGDAIDKYMDKNKVESTLDAISKKY